MFEYKNILVEKRDRYAVITLNRPDILNAISPLMAREVSDALDKLEQDREVFGVILTGAGTRAFCAGDEVDEVDVVAAENAASPVNPAVASVEWGRPIRDMLFNMEKYPYPIIAAIDGHCLGGGFNIALCCDLRVATDRAQFSMPELKIGFNEDLGGSKRLVDFVGMNNAKDIYLTGRRIKGDEAKAMNLVNRVVPPEKLMETAEELMKQCLANAPIAVKFTKFAMRHAQNMTIEGTMALESVIDAITSQSEDLIEGKNAFFARPRRDPVWKNR